MADPQNNPVIDKITDVVTAYAYAQLAEKIDAILKKLWAEKSRETEPERLALLDGKILAYNFTLHLMTGMTTPAATEEGE